MADPTKAANATATEAQAERAFTLEDITDDMEYLNILIYGGYGAGKTTLAATAADVEDMADVLLMDIESGQMVIKESDRIKHKERITRIRVESYRQMAKAHEFLKAHCRYRDMDTPEAAKKLVALEAKFRGVTPDKIKKPKRFYTVIIDSLSELNQLCIYEILGLPKPADINLDEVLSNDGDMEMPTYDTYNKNNILLQMIIRAYRDLPVNCLLVCHASYEQDELKRYHYAPGLTGKLSAQAQGFVDIVAYLKVGEAKEEGKESPRRLYIQPTGRFDAKNRKASIKEPHFDNPTMTKIWSALEKAKV